jgi:exosortase
MSETSAIPVRPRDLRPVLIPVVLGPCLLWGYWSILTEMARTWEKDPTYSHGFLVPLFALAILWLRRDKYPAAIGLRPHWSGLLLIALGAAMQLGGAYVFTRWTGAIALLPYVAGIVLLATGPAVLRWALPSIAFLAFMIPLPWSVEVWMKQPLQSISTTCSAYMLQTLGLPALTEGNIILLNDVELGIVDACSGLKMLIVFFALSTAMALLVRRRPLEKVLIVLSAVPIAVLSNVVRITVTGVMHEVAGSYWANLVFHDLAGWLMMPLALGLLWCELALLSLLIIEDAPAPSPATLLALDRTAPARG